MIIDTAYCTMFNAILQCRKIVINTKFADKKVIFKRALRGEVLRKSEKRQRDQKKAPMIHKNFKLCHKIHSVYLDLTQYIVYNLKEK